ncbi:MAG: DUF3253 domain-containing protein [Pseudomonadota bacterium]
MSDAERRPDPIAEAIVDALADGRSRSIPQLQSIIGRARAKPGEEIETIARYKVAVKQNALHLARAGVVEMTRKGAVVDPDDHKGVVRLRLAASAA